MPKQHPKLRRDHPRTVQGDRLPITHGRDVIGFNTHIAKVGANWYVVNGPCGTIALSDGHHKLRVVDGEVVDGRGNVVDIMTREKVERQAKEAYVRGQIDLDELEREVERAARLDQHNKSRM